MLHVEKMFILFRFHSSLPSKVLTHVFFCSINSSSLVLFNVQVTNPIKKHQKHKDLDDSDDTNHYIASISVNPSLPGVSQCHNSDPLHQGSVITFVSFILSRSFQDPSMDDHRSCCPCSSCHDYGLVMSIEINHENDETICYSCLMMSFQRFVRFLQAKALLWSLRNILTAWISGLFFCIPAFTYLLKKIHVLHLVSILSVCTDGVSVLALACLEISLIHLIWSLIIASLVSIFLLKNFPLCSKLTGSQVERL